MAAGQLANAHVAQEDRLRGGESETTFPLTTVDAAKAYIKSHGVTHLVAFEFTGALLLRLLGSCQAMSVDRRAALHAGPHYQGDVQDIVPLQEWEVIYFIGPPCYQHLRLDEYLAAKISDGRAYWAGALVLWCVCCEHARAAIVEQPDTICNDYFDLESMGGVEVFEFRTGRLGDEVDKFIRLTLRNLERPAWPQGGRPCQRF